MTSRRLVLLRHAQAEQFAASDDMRALTARGRRDAAAAGRWLQEQDLLPDLTIVSSAARTQETWACVADAAGSTLAPIVDGAVHQGSTDVALETLRCTQGDPGTVLLLGHNPTIASLAMLLDDGAGDAAVLARVTEGYPTCTAAVLEVHSPWSELEYGGATLRALHTVRES
ncbi:MAG: histidine phosphatase family protein [Nocardioides sp.]|nr:histidine phosphatase family protein [Nocardioides sp.]